MFSGFLCSASCVPVLLPVCFHLQLCSQCSYQLPPCSLVSATHSPHLCNSAARQNCHYCQNEELVTVFRCFWNNDNKHLFYSICHLHLIPPSDWFVPGWLHFPSLEAVLLTLACLCQAGMWEQHGRCFASCPSERLNKTLTAVSHMSDLFPRKETDL